MLKFLPRCTICLAGLTLIKRLIFFLRVNKSCFSKQQPWSVSHKLSQGSYWEMSLSKRLINKMVTLSKGWRSKCGDIHLTSWWRRFSPFHNFLPSTTYLVQIIAAHKASWIMQGFMGSLWHTWQPAEIYPISSDLVFRFHHNAFFVSASLTSPHPHPHTSNLAYQPV